MDPKLIKWIDFKSWGRKQWYPILGICFIAVCLSCAGCFTDQNQQAPVINAWLQSQAQQCVYRVKPGDTVYSIAWDFGLDYRTLVKANGLRPPYHLFSGQILSMSAQLQPAVSSKNASNVSHSENTNSLKLSSDTYPVKVHSLTRSSSSAHVPTQLNFAFSPSPRYILHWLWPTQGKVIEGYSTALAGNHGLNIAGVLGQPVRASASGKVVYSGTGVRGYGNLIIIKHNASYLSAYAYNQQLFVKMGQIVQAGQLIATMGHGENGNIMLHFEIRRNGQPVNPSLLLH